MARVKKGAVTCLNGAVAAGAAVKRPVGRPRKAAAAASGALVGGALRGMRVSSGAAAEPPKVAGLRGKRAAGGGTRAAGVGTRAAGGGTRAAGGGTVKVGETDALTTGGSVAAKQLKGRKKGTVAAARVGAKGAAKAAVKGTVKGTAKAAAKGTALRGKRASSAGVLRRGQALEQLEKVLLDRALSGDIQAAKLLYSRWEGLGDVAGASSEGGDAGSGEVGGSVGFVSEHPRFSAAYEQELDERIRALWADVFGSEG